MYTWAPQTQSLTVITSAGHGGELDQTLSPGPFSLRGCLWPQVCSGAVMTGHEASLQTCGVEESGRGQGCCRCTVRKSKNITKTLSTRSHQMPGAPRSGETRTPEGGAQGPSCNVSAEGAFGALGSSPHCFGRASSSLARTIAAAGDQGSAHAPRCTATPRTRAHQHVPPLLSWAPPCPRTKSKSLSVASAPTS